MYRIYRGALATDGCQFAARGGRQVAPYMFERDGRCRCRTVHRPGVIGRCTLCLYTDISSLCLCRWMSRRFTRVPERVRQPEYFPSHEVKGSALSTAPIAGQRGLRMT